MTFTLDDIALACQRVTGIRPDFDARRPIPESEWEREQRAAERGQDIAEGRKYAQPYEMDGRAADAWYGQENGLDWRRP